MANICRQDVDILENSYYERDALKNSSFKIVDTFKSI